MAEVQYPSNSNKSKQPPQSSIKGSVSGDVGVSPSAKQKLVEALFAKDIKAALSEYFWKRFLPSGKTWVLNGVHGAINSIFNWMGGGPTNGQTNYNSMSGSYPGQYINNTPGTNYQQIQENRGYPKASDLRFSLEDDAESCLIFLKAQIEDCGLVTVNTLYGYLGRTCEYTWNKYGWTNLNSAKVIDTRDGSPMPYILKLPKASPIDQQ